MTRRTALELLAGAPLAAAAARPNIVLFYADDLDADEIGCTADPRRWPSPTGARKLGFPGARGYADDRMLTPHIDGLARDGAVFSRFYITSPICTPSRCSLMTGRQATRSRGFLRAFPAGGPHFLAWNTPIDAEETNLAKSLRALGYATGIVGKWHNFPGSAGVAEVDRDMPEDADPRDPKIAALLRARHERAAGHLRRDIGFDFADRINVGNTEQTRPAAIRRQNLEWHTEGALDFLRQHHRRPFFLYYPLPVPHGQYFDLARLNPLATTAGMLEALPRVQPSREEVLARLKARGIDPRNAMAAWMDDTVGAVLTALDEYKVAGNTIVLFISDNPSRGKNTCYEGARVPALVRWPGKVRPGSRIDGLCANVDIPATLLAAGGGTAPGDMRDDGRSFLPQLTGAPPPRDWRDQLLLQVHNSRGVVTGNWKYIANRPREADAARIQADAAEAAKTGAPRKLGWNGQAGQNYSAEADFPAYYDADQLYDLDADLHEQRNLAAEPARAATLDDMKQRLSAVLKPLPHTFAEFKKA